MGRGGSTRPRSRGTCRSSESAGVRVPGGSEGWASDSWRSAPLNWFPLHLHLDPLAFTFPYWLSANLSPSFARQVLFMRNSRRGKVGAPSCTWTAPGPSVVHPLSTCRPGRGLRASHTWLRRRALLVQLPASAEDRISCGFLDATAALWRLRGLWHHSPILQRDGFEPFVATR